MTAATTGHGPHHVGRQNLPALALGAESGRLDDRVPEVVLVLFADLAAAQPYSQTDRVLPTTVVALQPLLHSDSAGQGSRGRGERHHQAISRFFTSVPPASAMAWRRTEKCPRRTSSADSGDSRCDSAVEPTTSVNRIATFSVVKSHPRLSHGSVGEDGNGLPIHPWDLKGATGRSGN